MKLAPNPPEHGFTLKELLVVLAVIVLVGLLILPFFSKADNRSHQINCINQLRSIALATRIWAGDHNDRYPVQVTTNSFGAVNFAAADGLFRYVQMMSNEISTPKILVCHYDSKRIAATNFGVGFGNSNLSYFLAINADEADAYSFLAGDSHLTNNAPRKNGAQAFSTNSPARWARERHSGKGNVAINDGSAAQLTTAGLADALANSGRTTNWLLFP